MRARVRGSGNDVGLRDRHKVDKLKRISDAAHKLFSKGGYEGTSLRDIAGEAGVALGTLSLYARDKRDLILMIFNKVIPPLLEQATANAHKQSAVVDSLVAFFEPFYRAYARNVTLYRLVLGQIYSGSGSVHASENDAIRLGLLAELAELARRAIASGECRSDIDLPLQARAFYFLYFAAVRAWLSQKSPRAEQGLEDLRHLFALQVKGILSRPT